MIRYIGFTAFANYMYPTVKKYFIFIGCCFNNLRVLVEYEEDSQNYQFSILDII